MIKEIGLNINMEEKIFVTKSNLPEFNEYIEEIKDLWNTGILTNMGIKHQLLQKKLIEHLKLNDMELVVNGHMALEISLQSMELKGEVITTPFTFASTTHAIVRSGLTPVFCDINPIDFTIDAYKIESLITDRTTAILPVHVYGNICNIDKIQKIANKYNLKVIYDAAHSFGVELNNQGIGTFGDISCFSFHATKVFNSIEGGALCINNNNYIEKIKLLRNFGIEADGSILYSGTNAKMNEFAAAMGLCNLKYMNLAIKQRKIIFERYKEHLENIKGITLNPYPPNNVKSNYAYFPIIFDKDILGINRNDIQEILAKENIFSRKYFYPITSQTNCYINKYKGDTPIAKYISNNVLCLPIYPGLNLEIIDKICNIILNKINKEK